MAVPGSSTTNLSILKRLWGSDVPTPMYKASKALAFIKKDNNFGGEGRYVVVSVAPPGGGSGGAAPMLENHLGGEEARNYRRLEFDTVAPHVGRSLLEVGSGLGDFASQFVDRVDRLVVSDADHAGGLHRIEDDIHAPGRVEQEQAHEIGTLFGAHHPRIAKRLENHAVGIVDGQCRDRDCVRQVQSAEVRSEHP